MLELDESSSEIVFCNNGTDPVGQTFTFQEKAGIEWYFMEPFSQHTGIEIDYTIIRSGEFKSNVNPSYD